jgi:hypothetical protein
MAHINYDDDQQDDYNSTDYYFPRSSRIYDLLATVILFILFAWFFLAELARRAAYSK